MKLFAHLPRKVTAGGYVYTAMKSPEPITNEQGQRFRFQVDEADRVIWMDPGLSMLACDSAIERAVAAINSRSPEMTLPYKGRVYRVVIVPDEELPKCISVADCRSMIIRVRDFANMKNILAAAQLAHEMLKDAKAK